MGMRWSRDSGKVNFRGMGFPSASRAIGRRRGEAAADVVIIKEAKFGPCPILRRAPACPAPERGTRTAVESAVLCRPAAFRLRWALTLSRFCLFRLSARSRRPVQSSSGPLASCSWLIGPSDITGPRRSMSAILSNKSEDKDDVGSLRPAYTGWVDVFITSHQPVP